MRKLRHYGTKTLARDLNIDLDQAVKLLTARKDGHGLKTFDAILSAHGVERVESKKDRNASCACDSSLFDNHSFLYVNMGDSYIPTIIMYHGKFFVACMADLVEKYPNRYY